MRSFLYPFYQLVSFLEGFGGIPTVSLTLRKAHSKLENTSASCILTFTRYI